MHAALVPREGMDSSKAACEQENCKQEPLGPLFPLPWCINR